MSGCASFVPLLEPFIDGELSPERMVEVEQHISMCRACMERVRWDNALRISIREVAHEAAPVTEEFEQRVRVALDPGDPYLQVFRYAGNDSPYFISQIDAQL